MGPNGLDTMVPTANDHSRMVVWQAYDRLVSHGEKTLADGTVSYDAKVVTPELAESWESDRRRQDLHLPSAQGRHLPRRLPGDGQGRQMVVRPGHRRRRLSRRCRWRRDRW